MSRLTVRDAILALLDFPLDSDICIEDGYGSDSYPILNIYHDSEYDDMGYLIYSYTSIVHGGNLNICSDAVLNRDYRSSWVNENETFEIFDDETGKLIKFKFKDHKIVKLEETLEDEII